MVRAIFYAGMELPEFEELHKLHLHKHVKIVNDGDEEKARDLAHQISARNPMVIGPQYAVSDQNNLGVMVFSFHAHRPALAFETEGAAMGLTFI